MSEWSSDYPQWPLDRFAQLLLNQALGPGARPFTMQYLRVLPISLLIGLLENQILYSGSNESLMISLSLYPLYDMNHSMKHWIITAQLSYDIE